MDLITVLTDCVANDDFNTMKEMWSECSRVERREYIEEAQHRIELMAEEAPADIPITHHFGKGTYGRQCVIPKGTVCIGKVYHEGHVNVMMKGKLLLITETSCEIVEGINVGINKPNTKKFGLILEDTHWVTVMPRAEGVTDPDIILASHASDTHRDTTDGQLPEECGEWKS